MPRQRFYAPDGRDCRTAPRLEPSVSKFSPRAGIVQKVASKFAASRHSDELADDFAARAGNNHLFDQQTFALYDGRGNLDRLLYGRDVSSQLDESLAANRQRQMDGDQLDGRRFDGRVGRVD